jgi:outer membrane autotransporter protein
MRSANTKRCAVIFGLSFAAGPAAAADAEFQDFFFQVCGAPSGELAARCAETPGGLGNLSGDSESSLNPSQGLGNGQTATSLAQTRSNAARERGERLRDGEEPVDDGAARYVSGPFALLVNVHATWFERDAGDQERGFDGNSTAVELGLDYRSSERTVLGALAGFETMDYDFDAENPGVNFVPAPTAGRVESDTWYLTVFGSVGLGVGGFVELAAGYEQTDGTYRRDSVFQESTRTRPQVDVRAEGDADGDVLWASLNAGYDFHHGPASFGPYAGVTFARSELDGYTERDLSGSGLNMSFADAERDSVLGHLGLRASYAFSGSAGVFIPQLRVEFQHEFEDERPSVTGRFVLDSAGTSYSLAGDEVDQDFVNAGLSLSAILPNGWVCFADYAVLLASDAFDRQRATLGLRVEF